MIRIAAQYTVRPGAESDVEDIVRRFVRAVRHNEPSTDYRAYRLDGGRDFLHVMQFADEDAHEKHRGADYTLTLVDELYPRCQQEPTFAPLSAIELPRSKTMNAQASNPQAVVDAFVEEYKNQHNWDCVDDYVAEDCQLHLPLPGLPSGREGMRINGRMVCTAFPDVHVTREFAVVEGNIVVERAHAKATHQGELMGVAPTGNPVSWSELHAYRIVDGMIAEIWTEADFLGIMVQIGAVEMPSP